nr:AAA-like domain-containing protein [Nostoc sp. 'Peltigera membranacea cyanobiont' N6]
MLLGVATPSDLIQNKNRTPFNIGKGIELTGFEFAEALPLIKGFSGQASNPEAVLKEILGWTGGQPFLTQKVINQIKLTKLSSSLLASITSRGFRLKINTSDRFLRTSFFWVYSTL